MYRSIMVPLDGSALSEKAIPYATALAKAGGGRLILFRAVDRLKVEPEPTDPTAHLESCARAAREAGIDVEPVIYEQYHEDSGKVIVDEARSRSVDLIVMSTHGRSGMGRFIYGSVADRVLREAGAPVMLVPMAVDQPWPTDRPLKVLVAHDLSELAAEALTPAADLARSLGASITLLSVVQPPTYAYAEGYAYIAPEPEVELEAARQDLEPVAAELRKQGLDVTAQVELGFPSSLVAEIAQDIGADLIVMATHGRGGLARLVMGSTATGAVQRATVPVLLFRPNAIQAQAAEAATGEPTVSAPDGATISLTLNAREIDILQRAIGKLLYQPEQDWALARPARDLLERLRQAESRLGQTATTSS